MSLWLTLETALEALRRNVMRTMLTALGIIIGVAAVIVMMALGNGARASIESRIRSAGTNLIIVMPGSATVGGVRLGQGARTTLTPADAEAITRDVPGVAALSPGATTYNDEQTRRNFERVQRLVLPGVPLKSPLLVNPLAEEAGGSHWHGGGKHWQSQNDPEWQTLASWVRGS